MTAGLECHIQRRPIQWHRRTTNRVDFRVVATELLRPTFANDPSFLDNDTADCWIGLCNTFRSFRQAAGLEHQFQIVGRLIHTL